MLTPCMVSTRDDCLEQGERLKIPSGAKQVQVFCIRYMPVRGFLANAMLFYINSVECYEMGQESTSWSQIRPGPDSARICRIWDRDVSGSGYQVRYYQQTFRL